MAKSYKQAKMRIATTINARYYQTDDIADGYFIDGRFPRQNEQRSVDRELGSEDRGNVLSIYGRPESEDQAWQETLVALSDQVKAGNHLIDDELNLLAEASLETTGRQALSSGGREPYFAGIMTQDGEAVAITLGDGGAYLYRNDILYALTNDDFPLEPIDLNGNTVDMVDSYAAGSAGTVRYSNIVELEQNDVLIVCNRDVLAAVGQKEFMRHLYDAEDASDAAGRIVTAASANSPGVAMQIGMSFVEYIMPLDRPQKSGLNLGRFATASMTQDEIRQAAATPQGEIDAKTQQFHPDMLTRGAGSGVSGTGAPPEPSQYSRGRGRGETAPMPPVSSDTDRYSRMAASSFSRQQGGRGRDDVDYPEPGPHTPYRPEDDAMEAGYLAASERYKTTPQQTSGRRRIGYDTDPDRGYGIHDLDDTGAYEDYDDYDDLDDRGRTKKIVVLVILGAVILVSIYALIRLLLGGGDTPSTQPQTTTAPVSTITQTDSQPALPPVTTDPTEPASTTTAGTEADPSGTQEDPETTDTAPPGSRTYTVQAGDSMWRITQRHYGNVSDALIEHILKANNMTSPNIYPGQELIIPPPPVN